MKPAFRVDNDQVNLMHDKEIMNILDHILEDIRARFNKRHRVNQAYFGVNHYACDAIFMQYYNENFLEFRMAKIDDRRVLQIGVIPMRRRITEWTNTGNTHRHIDFEMDADDKLGISESGAHREFIEVYTFDAEEFLQEFKTKVIRTNNKFYNTIMPCIIERASQLDELHNNIEELYSKVSKYMKILNVNKQDVV